MDRREFMAAGAALGLVALRREHPATQEPVRLRTITYNILACKGYPETSGNERRLRAERAEIPERLAAELKTHAPDIVSLQEAPAEEVVARIADGLGMRAVYFPGGWPGNEDWPGGFPGAILTKLPILEVRNCPMARDRERSEDLFTRHWGMAVLDAPFGRLPVFSAHLHPSDATVRAREVTEALAAMAQVLDAEGRFLLQGDLNHVPDGPEHARWKAAELTDAFEVKGEGPQRFTFSSTEPRQYIDYVWAAGDLAPRIQSARVLYEGKLRTDPEDDTSYALSDHVPVMVEFG